FVSTGATKARTAARCQRRRLACLLFEQTGVRTGSSRARNGICGQPHLRQALARAACPTREGGTMDELIKMVTDRGGSQQDKARSADEVVLNHLKGRLPGPVASQLTSALSGGGAATGGDGRGLGEMLGGGRGSQP